MYNNINNYVQPKVFFILVHASSSFAHVHVLNPVTVCVCVCVCVCSECDAVIGRDVC